MGERKTAEAVLTHETFLIISDPDRQCEYLSRVLFAYPFSFAIAEPCDRKRKSGAVSVSFALVSLTALGNMNQ